MAEYIVILLKECSSRLLFQVSNFSDCSSLGFAVIIQIQTVCSFPSVICTWTHNLLVLH